MTGEPIRRLRLAAQLLRKAELEPWMFGCEVTVDGRRVPGQLVQFGRRARVRMAYRALRGDPMHLDPIEP